MASNIKDIVKEFKPELTFEELKIKTNVSDQQLDTTIEQSDIYVLSGFVDNINDGYLEAMNLTPGQQTDVRKRENVEGTLVGMMLALKYWLNSQLRGTFRALIVILLSLDKILVARQVFEYLSKRDFPTPSIFFKRRNPRLSFYRNYLETFYTKLTLSFTTTQWPPISTKKVFKLAMIQKDKIQRGKIDDKFVRLTIKGRIDDILFQKKPVLLKDIFSNSEDDERKFVLIEGAPGSGKSTLALHICQEWAKGELFQEFDIAILVRLRDPTLRNANTIANILPCIDIKMATEQETVLKALCGEGVLWVLDGWDELPPDLPPDSIINKLIRPGMSQESPLHKSTIIVTSRPSSSAQLHPIISSRVEVLGFTQQELEQYFTDCLKGKSQAVQALLDRIRENPAVESSCYLPLNASIIVNCFLSDNNSLPTSNCGIFSSVIQSSLKRYLQERLGNTIPVGNITSPDSLPSEVRTPFKSICQLAYHGIDEDKVTFTDKDLTNFSINKDISLLQSVPSILGNNQLIYYCFLHLSIQELLAAIHISLMYSKDQIFVFEKLFSHPRFNAVFQFYSGITKLKESRWFFSKLPQWLYPYPTAILDLVKKIIKSECEKTTDEPKYLLLSLINCLYEAEDPSLFRLVADLLNYQLNLSFTKVDPNSCLSVGYFTSLATKPFSLNLYNCSIGDQGCKFLVQGLSKYSHSHSTIDLHLKYNNIHEEGIQSIAKLLRTNTTLQYLDLSLNNIGNIELRNFCHALSTNTSLKTLNLAKGKLTNHSIVELTELTNNIEYLILYGNDSITEDGMKILARRLTTDYRKLNRLSIPNHLHFCINTMFKETNEKRKIFGLTKITVH